ncbi:hypothetical protein [Pseudomonas atacamensis]|uniref:hypothetical protein n=1 Tax=Pseudomonas atacamensis TaxID=2565368 RepID=UPI0019D03CF2|nr:hypothetical protein [Pseudomonas atacamensis]QSL90497.1 hypothetical protein JWU58_27035 [Pseudomonas atacamensis]
MADMENVIQIGDLRLARLSTSLSRTREACKHPRLQMEPIGEIVTCKDCKQQVSPYWALSMLADHWQEQTRKLDRQLAEVKEHQGALLHLTAAKRLESEWRKQNTVPCCPHCARGVFPGDGMGSSTISKVFELGLRARETAERKELGLPAVKKLAPGKPAAPKRAVKAKSTTKPLPKWKDAPAWAQWLTHSPSGPWTWHEQEPAENEPGAGYWSAGQTAFAGTTPVPTDTNLLKQKRPEAVHGATQ